MIEKLNHYSFTTPASIHDEEALTALELAGRTGAKMNEVIDEIDKFESDVNKTVTEHQEVIDGVPEMVSSEVLKLKEVGTFDEAINKRLKQSMYGTVSVGAKITLTQDGTATAGGLLVKFPNKISLWKPEGENGTTKEWVDITTGLSDVYINGDKCDIEVNYGCGLYYDVTSDQLIMCPPSYAYINMICLIINRYGRAVGGCLFDEYMSYVEDTTDTINTQVANNYSTYKSTEYAFIYAGNDNDVVIKGGTSGALSVTIPANLTLLSAPSNNGTSIVTANCIDGILSYTTVNDNGTITVNLPYRTTLFYNLSTGKFGVSPLSYCYPGLIIMVNNIYSNAVTGCLIDEINAKERTSNTFNRNYETSQAIKDFIPSAAPSEQCNFLLFSDPHLITGAEWERKTSAHIDYLKRVYQSTPTDLIIDMGDWLTDSHTLSEAIYALGFIRAQFKGVPRVNVNGNHDTNYQGVTQLSQAQLNHVGFSGKSYYSYETTNTKFIVLDTQTDIEANNSTDYNTEQRNWFYNELLNNTKPHVIILTHIFFVNEEARTSGTVHSLISSCAYIARMYNNRQNYNNYDYTNAVGQVEVILGGHLHADYTGVFNQIPYVLFKNYDGLVPTFDLVNVDYTNRRIICKREGNGENRRIDLQASVLTTTASTNMEVTTQ